MASPANHQEALRSIQFGTSVIAATVKTVAFRMNDGRHGFEH
jgi:hypothetical protein